MTTMVGIITEKEKFAVSPSSKLGKKTVGTTMTMPGHGWLPQQQWWALTRKKIEFCIFVIKTYGAKNKNRKMVRIR